MEQAPKNIKELRDSLAENYSKMLNKKIPLGLGKELANMAGKMINSCKIEMEYNTLMQRKNKIDFLEVNDKSE